MGRSLYAGVTYSFCSCRRFTVARQGRGGAPRPCSGSVVEFGDDTDVLHLHTGPASTWGQGVVYRAFDLIGRPGGRPVHFLRRWSPTAHPLGGRVNDAPLQGAADRRGQVHGVPEL
ncbi:MAG: hypothetical protein WBN82_11255 [Porticoccaceae bacterium]